LRIQNLESDVELTSKFGELLIDNVISSLKGLKLNLSFSDATIDLKNLKEDLKIVAATNVSSKDANKNFILNGSFTLNNSKVNIKGKQSELKVKKQ
jgi:hypothetical protein